MASEKRTYSRNYKRIICSDIGVALFEMECGYFCMVEARSYEEGDCIQRCTIPFVEYAAQILSHCPMEFDGDEGLTPEAKQKILANLSSVKAYPLSSWLDLSKIDGLCLTQKEIADYNRRKKEHKR